MKNSRRFIAILAMVLIASSNCFAQSEDDENDPPNGIRFGYQNSNFANQGDDDFEYDNLSAGYVGIYRNLKIVPLIHIETGLEYMQAGAQGALDSKIKLHYIVLPVQGVVKIGPVFGLIGINGNFKVGEKFTIDGDEMEIPEDQEAPFVDVAVDVGAGVKLWRISAELRYYWGLTEVYENLNNRYAQLGLKFQF